MFSNINIDNGNSFDWGFTSEEYSKFRDIYPTKLYIRLRELGVAADGTSLLDLGTGTGILPQNMYNKNADIVGVDISAEQIKYAKLNAYERAMKIKYIAAPAEKTGLPDNSFDCITAAQCFAYFDKEKMKTEIKRMLKPGGRFIEIYMTWCLDDEIAKNSISLVKQYNDKWNEASGFNSVNDDLFEGRITESFYCDIPFTRESWHGRMCACRGTLASMSRDQFEKWSAEHIKMLSAYPESFTVRHKVYITYFEL